METFEAINKRVSIRKYQDKDIPQAILDQILTAATLSPSGKNKQPWKFYVVRGEKRAEMIREMQKGMDRLGGDGESTPAAPAYTIRVMEQAPVTILVLQSLQPPPPLLPRDTQEVYGDMGGYPVDRGFHPEYAAGSDRIRAWIALDLRCFILAMKRALRLGG